MSTRRFGRAGLALLAVVVALALGGARWYQWEHSRCCAPPPAQFTHVLPGELVIPNDFVVTVHNGTGSVAPKYAYEYRLRIDRSGNVELQYWPASAEKLAVRDTFHVTHAVIDSLARMAMPLRAASTRKKSREIVDGGVPLSLTITAAGTTTDVDPYELPDGWFGPVKDIAEFTKAIIPAAVWEKCVAAQGAYASSLEARNSSEAPRR